MSTTIPENISTQRSSLQMLRWRKEIVEIENQFLIFLKEKLVAVWGYIICFGVLIELFNKLHLSYFLQ